MELSALLLNKVCTKEVGKVYIPEKKPILQVVDTVAKAGSAKDIAEEGFKNKIKKMLIAGTSQSDVAKAVGVSASYISQLMNDVNFAKSIQEGRAESAIGKVNLNSKYDEVEDLLITKLKTQIPFIARTNDIVNALRVVGSRKREPIIEAPQNLGGSQVVHLHLSQRVANKFILNGHKDIIGLGEQTFIPMSSLELLKEAKELLIPPTVDNVGNRMLISEQESRNVLRNGTQEEDI